MTTSLRSALIKEHEDLSLHPVFGRIQTLAQLRQFMAWHVFAVWDFMALVKRLQAELTCLSVPWFPPAYPKAARLINEIVLGEESDLGFDGTPVSHFKLYLGAMREVGANAAPIEDFVGMLKRGVSLDHALAHGTPHPAVSAFVRSTLMTAQSGTLPGVLASFFYGRENVIPAMFGRLLEQWQISSDQAPTFTYYLKRHIDLDGTEHGPAALTIIAEIVGDDPASQSELLTGAITALQERRRLWDALLTTL